MSSNSSRTRTVPLLSNYHSLAAVPPLLLIVLLLSSKTSFADVYSSTSSSRGSKFSQSFKFNTFECVRLPHSKQMNQRHVERLKSDKQSLLSLRGGGEVGLSFLLPSILSTCLPMNIRRKLILGGIVGTVAAVPIAGEAYSRGAFSRQPTTTNSKEDLKEPEKGWSEVKHVTIVFHGAGGQDQYTDELMSKLKAVQSTSNDYHTIVDWSDSSSNILQASFKGQRIGRKVASSLVSKCFLSKNDKEQSQLESLHVVGISVGAFAADSCVTEFKKQLARLMPKAATDDQSRSGRDVFVQETLLDPFTLRGVLNPWYGDKNFGKNADYAQQFLNTDDPVPQTNKPLSFCACTDVTDLRPPDIFGHDWPLVYYARSADVGLVELSKRRPAGEIIMANK